MKKLSRVSIAFAIALTITPASLFAQNWDFTYNDGTVVATGTLAGSLIAPGEYDITSGTIDVSSGGAVQGSGGFLVSNPNAPGATTNTILAGGGTYITYDDLLFPGSNPQLDGNGLLFDLNGVAINIFGNGDNQYGIFEGNWAYAVALYGGGGPYFNAVSAPEGGASLLYLLVAGAFCFGSMFFISRSRFAS